MRPHQLLAKAESVRWVERPAEFVARKVRRALGSSRLDRLLRGAWLGHPVHPLLVTVPIGAWVCAPVLDLGFGQREAAQRLVTIGLLATPPAVVVGLADFSELDLPQQRVGALHAVTNVVSAACFVRTSRCQARREDTAARTWTMLGLLAVAAGGALGGHLSYAQAAGVHRWQSEHAPGGGTASP